MFDSPRRCQFQEDQVIEFITDVEGNLNYLNKLVACSSILSWNEDGDLSILQNGLFVFGGDATDRGPGDIRVTKALISLKERHPIQVVLLQGNRDVVKLRFGSELHPDELPGIGDKHWDYKYETYLKERSLDSNRISSCKWILCTMGCESERGRTNTFEARREELGVLGQANDDESVVESFYQSVNPDGDDPWMLKFLQLSDIVFTIGDCLFVHAGVTQLSIGEVDLEAEHLFPGCDKGAAPSPGMPGGASAPPGAAVAGSNVDAWALALSRWKDGELAEYCKQPRWRDELAQRAPCSLSRGAGTLSYYCTWTQWCNSFTPAPELPSEVTSWLQSQGISRVFQGHKPHGQCPLIVKHGNGVFVWHCDTSYSDLKAAEDTRGDAVSVVRIFADKTIVEGTVQANVEHRYELPQVGAGEICADIPESLLGEKLPSGAYVATVLNEGLLLCSEFRDAGFTVIATERTVKDVAVELLEAKGRTG